jgi:hypothetical protein
MSSGAILPYHCGDCLTDAGRAASHESFLTFELKIHYFYLLVGSAGKCLRGRSIYLRKES